MDYLDFEKNIKSTLSSSRKELNMDQLLKDLDIQPKQKTRRGFAYFGGLALIGFLFISGIGLYLYSSNNNSTALASEDMLTEQNNNYNVSSTTMSSIGVNQSTIQDSKQVQSASQIVQETETNNQAKISKKTDLNTRSTKTNNQAAPLNNKLKNQDTTERSSTIFKTKETTTQYDQEVIASSSIEKTTLSFPKTEQYKINNSARLNSNVGLNLNSKSITDTDARAEVLLVADLPLIKEFSVENKDEEMVALPKVKGCPTFKDRNWSFSFLPEIGYGWPIKNLEQNLPGYEDLFDARTFNEITLESFQIGGYLEMKHHSGLYFKTGVAYATITEQMTLKQKLTTIDTVREVIEVIETPDSTIIIKGDVIYETEINRNNKVHYTLQSYDIPVGIGYSHLMRDFTLDFEAGVRFNVMTRAKGRIFSTENQFEELGNNERHFKRQVGLGVFAGLYIKKQLSEFGEVYLSPRFVFNTGPVSTDINPIKQKYHSFGMHLGYVYTFAVKKL